MFTFESIPVQNIISYKSQTFSTVSYSSSVFMDTKILSNTDAKYLFFFKHPCLSVSLSLGVCAFTNEIPNISLSSRGVLRPSSR